MSLSPRVTYLLRAYSFMGAPPDNKGLKRIINAFFFSMHGFRSCFKTEEAFQQELILTFLMIPASFWIGQTVEERLLLIGSIILVLIVELLNTGIERAIDRISFEKNELSKEAKDMGSAAVFLSLIFCGLVWGSISWLKFFS